MTPAWNSSRWRSLTQGQLDPPIGIAHGRDARPAAHHVPIGPKQHSASGWDVQVRQAEGLEVIADPAERLRAVFAGAFADRAGVMRVAALMAASTHPLVQPIVRRVTDRRLRYVADMYVRLGLPPARARRRAVMLYQTCIGFFDRLRLRLADATEAEVRACGQEVIETLVPRSDRAVIP